MNSQEEFVYRSVIANEERKREQAEAEAVEAEARGYRRGVEAAAEKCREFGTRKDIVHPDECAEEVLSLLPPREKPDADPWFSDTDHLVPGWYWMREKCPDSDECVVEMSYDRNDEMCVSAGGTTRWISTLEGEWEYQPVQPPAAKGGG